MAEAERRQENYNRKTFPPHHFFVNDRVWLYTPAVGVGKSSKLAKLWTSPLRVLVVDDNGTLEVIAVEGTRRHRRVHYNGVKPCYRNPVEIRPETEVAGPPVRHEEAVQESNPPEQQRRLMEDQPPAVDFYVEPTVPALDEMPGPVDLPVGYRRPARERNPPT